jgi:uncharacterized protein (DUF3820 family)
MKMPWGKFKGEDIEDIPSDYLQWLAENCENDKIATNINGARTMLLIFTEIKK